MKNSHRDYFPDQAKQTPAPEGMWKLWVGIAMHIFFAALCVGTAWAQGRLDLRWLLP